MRKPEPSWWIQFEQLNRKESDERERGRLADLGYRILVIRYDSPLEEQCVANEDVLGLEHSRELLCL